MFRFVKQWWALTVVSKCEEKKEKKRKRKKKKRKRKTNEKTHTTKTAQNRDLGEVPLLQAFVEILPY